MKLDNKIELESDIGAYLDAKLNQAAMTDYDLEIREKGEVVLSLSGGKNKNAVFDIASISKLFTTALILKAHEEGQFEFETPVSNFLDNFNKSEINIKDLLTHNVDFGLSLSDLRNQFPDSSSFKEAIMNLPIPQSALGHINYQNLDFIFLGFILEKINGRKFEEIVADFIKNLGLKNTFLGSNLPISIKTIPTETLSSGYQVNHETHDESARLLGGLAGNAGVFSNSADLALFGEKWINGSILKPETIDQVFQNYDPSQENPQGLGWWCRVPGTPNSKNRGIYCHPGFTGSLLVINPSTQQVCSFLCNRTYFGRDNKQHLEMYKTITQAFFI